MNFLDVVPCTYVRSVSLQTPPYEKTAGFTAIFWGEKSSHVKFANYLTDGRSGFTESCFSEQQSRCAEIWEITRFRAKPHGAEKSIGVTCEHSPSCNFCIFAKIQGGFFFFLRKCRIFRLTPFFSVYSGDKRKLSKKLRRYFV